LQISVGFAPAVTVGEGETLTVMTVEATQDPALPSNVYVVVTEGETTTTDPVNPPGFQV
jgi:hypothetical protein